jgi:hypothetical protein
VTVRKVGRTLLGLALVFAATACDDNPLAEDRDEAAYFRLNPSNVAVNAGGTVKVDAVVVNKYGSATNEAVTATACDAKVSAVADTGRTIYEFPERFVVTGVALGSSCIVVRGGGITDTVAIRVVPASINIAGVDTVLSGQTSTPTLQFLNAAGQVITGFTAADLTFTNLTTAQGVVDSIGRVTGQAPGTGRFIAALSPKWGATRVDTVSYVVRAGNFSGTTAMAASVNGGAGITFTAGTLAFDSDTNVQLTAAGDTWTCYGDTSLTTSKTCMLPFGLPSGTNVTYAVTNIGPNQVASIGSFTTTSATPAQDTGEPDGSIATFKKSMVNGESIFGTVSATDIADFVRVNAQTAGTKTFTVDWSDGSDIDMHVQTATGGTVVNRLTSQKPETGTGAVTANTAYYIWVEMYEAASSAPIRYKLTVSR